jgi:hypothetical protein
MTSDPVDEVLEGWDRTKEEDDRRGTTPVQVDLISGRSPEREQLKREKSVAASEQPDDDLDWEG